MDSESAQMSWLDLIETDWPSAVAGGQNNCSDNVEWMLLKASRGSELVWEWSISIHAEVIRFRSSWYGKPFASVRSLQKDGTRNWKPWWNHPRKAIQECVDCYPSITTGTNRRLILLSALPADNFVIFGWLEGEMFMAVHTLFEMYVCHFSRTEDPATLLQRNPPKT